MGFKKVIFAAIGYIIEYNKPLAKALLFPFSLYMLLDLSELLDHNFFTALVFSILTLMVQTLFAITTHRMILLGPKSIPEWGLFKWSKRETFFALHIVGLSLITIPIMPLGSIPFLGGPIFIGLVCWLFSRLSLVFPAIAINQGGSFKSSWELTKKHQMLMFLVVIVFPITLLIPAYLFSLFPYTFLLTSLLTNLLMTFTTILVVAALSASYKVVCHEVYESKL